MDSGNDNSADPLLARRVVVCLSGGLDSTCLLLHLLARRSSVHAISFDYGQKHKLELERLQQNLQYLQQQGHSFPWQLIDLSSLQSILHSALIDADWEVPTGHYESGQMKQTVVPNRNAIFASIAFASALSLSNRHDEQVDIALGVHQGDHEIYPDCRAEFYEVIHQAFQLGNWDADRVHLYLPFLQDDKKVILQQGLAAIQQLGLDSDTILKNTLTSYAPGADGTSSGLTGSDVERILAFDALGLVDPIPYAQPWDQVLSRARQMEAEFRASG